MKTKNLKRVFDIINAEGPILTLYKGSGNRLLLSSYLADGSGTVYYGTVKSLLGQFARSEITVEQLYTSSDDFLVKQINPEGEFTCLKEEFSGKLQNGESFFGQIYDDMKNLKFSQGYAKY